MHSSWQRVCWATLLDTIQYTGGCQSPPLSISKINLQSLITMDLYVEVSSGRGAHHTSCVSPCEEHSLLPIFLSQLGTWKETQKNMLYLTV